MMKFKDIFSNLLSFIYPQKCICCKRIINDKAYICDECSNEILWNSKKICVWCGLEEKHCRCKFYTYRFRKIVAPFKNNGIIKTAFYDFKFRNRTYCARFFSENMAEYVKKYYSDIKFDVICPIPMNYFDMLGRGYNQSEILAKDIGKILGIKLDNKIIYAHKKRVNQHKTKGAKDRFTNIRSRYYYKQKISYKNVLLVDDIKTTGATLDECARQLMLAGAENVYCVTALVTEPKKRERKAIISQLDKIGLKNI